MIYGKKGSFPLEHRSLFHRKTFLKQYKQIQESVKIVFEYIFNNSKNQNLNKFIIKEKNGGNHDW